MQECNRKLGTENVTGTVNVMRTVNVIEDHKHKRTANVIGTCKCNGVL